MSIAATFISALTRGSSGSASLRRSAERRARRGGSSCDPRPSRWSKRDRCRRNRPRSSSWWRARRPALVRRRRGEQHGDRASAHRRKAPVVLERAARERLRVGVTRDLERVASRDRRRCERPRRPGAGCPRLPSSACREPESNSTSPGRRISMRLLRTSTLRPSCVSFWSFCCSSSKRLRICVELLGAARVLFERLALLGEARAQVLEVDAALGELALELVDLLKCRGVVGLTLLVRLALRRELVAEALVLANLLIPLLLRVAAGGDEKREHHGAGAKGGSCGEHENDPLVSVVGTDLPPLRPDESE